MIRMVSTCMATVWLSVSAASQIVHPGIYSSQSDLDFIKATVNGSPSHPMKDGYAAMLRFSGSSLSWNTTVHSVVDYVGSGSSPSEDAIREAGHAIYAHALQWVITGDQRHADKAISILNAWSSGCRDIKDERQNRLETSWDIPIWLGGAEIIRYYNNGAAGWSPSDIAAFDSFLDMLIADSRNTWNKRGNNWITSGALAQICVAVWRSDQDALDKAVANLKDNIRHYIYSDGELDETTRDCNHAEYGIIGLMLGAEVAWQQGRDVYSYVVPGDTKPRLWMGMEFHAKALLGTPVGGTQNCSGSDKKAGGWECAYHGYKHRMGVDIPHTERFVLNQNRPSHSEHHFPRWSTLTHAELEAQGASLGFVTAALPQAYANEPYSGQLESRNAEGAVTWQILSGSLPAGLSLSPSGRISGTVTASGGDYPFSIQISDQAGNTATGKLTITVRTPVFSADPYYGTAVNWEPTPRIGTWDVVTDDGDLRYAIRAGVSTSGQKPGAYSLIKERTFSDFTFEFKAKGSGFSGNEDVATLWGFQDDNHFYYALFNANERYSQAFKVVNGQRTELAAASTALLTDNNYHTFTLTRAGDQVTIYRDDTEVMSFSDNTYGSGRIGIGSLNDYGWFDDITVSGNAVAIASKPAPVAPKQYTTGRMLTIGTKIAVPGGIAYDIRGRRIRRDQAENMRNTAAGIVFSHSPIE
jgi:hypothetical protein